MSKNQRDTGFFWRVHLFSRSTVAGRVNELVNSIETQISEMASRWEYIRYRHKWYSPDGNFHPHSKSRLLGHWGAAARCTMILSDTFYPKWLTVDETKQAPTPPPQAATSNGQPSHRGGQAFSVRQWADEWCSLTVWQEKWVCQVRQHRLRRIALNHWNWIIPLYYLSGALCGNALIIDQAMSIVMKTVNLSRA